MQIEQFSEVKRKGEVSGKRGKKEIGNGRRGEEKEEEGPRKRKERHVQRVQKLLLGLLFLFSLFCRHTASPPITSGTHTGVL